MGEKLTDFQFWLLNNRIGAFGWRSKYAVSRTKKDETALQALLKKGLVEQEYEGDAAMIRLTDAGRAALSREEGR